MSEAENIQHQIVAGDAAHEANQWSEAVQHYLPLLNVLPGDRLERLGFALSQLDRYEEARDVFLRIFEKEPHVGKWPYMIGYQYYDAQDWPNALVWYEKALAIWPNYFVVLYRASYCHYQLNRPNIALGYLSRLFDCWEGLPEAKRPFDRSKAVKAFLLAGKIYTTKNMPRPAIHALRQALSLAPDSGDAHYHLGKALADIGQHAEAVLAFEAAHKCLGPKDYVLAALGSELERLERFEEAENVYRKIPTRFLKPYILKQMGSVYLQLGKIGQATEALQKSLSKEPDNHNARFLLGKAYLRSDFPQRAARELRKAVDLKQKNYHRPFAEAEELLATITVEPAPEPVLESASDCANIGRVEAFNQERGFGFIRALSGERIFFHCSAWLADQRITLEQAVRYTPTETPKGLAAKAIVPISASETSPSIEAR